MALTSLLINRLLIQSSNHKLSGLSLFFHQLQVRSSESRDGLSSRQTDSLQLHRTVITLSSAAVNPAASVAPLE